MKAMWDLVDKHFDPVKVLTPDGPSPRANLQLEGRAPRAAICHALFVNALLVGQRREDHD